MILVAVCLPFAFAGAAAGADQKPTVTRIDPPQFGFFSKEVDYKGIPIKAHAVVDDQALIEAYDRLDLMLRHMPDAVSNMVTEGVELHIIGKDQGTSDLPENRTWKGRKYDGDQDIDQRTRGVGGLMVSCGEENLLKLAVDRYRGRDICIHEFAHTIQMYGLSDDVRAMIRKQYKTSTEAGLWKTAYAATNEGEYFAETSMWYFGTGGDYGKIDPRPKLGKDWLREYDRGEYDLIDRIYSGSIPIHRLKLVTIKAISPARGKNLRSTGDGSVKTNIRFDNRTNETVQVFWIDGDGKRVPYAVLSPGQKQGQETFVGHVWLVTDAAGKALAVYVPDRRPGIAAIVAGR